MAINKRLTPAFGKPASRLPSWAASNQDIREIGNAPFAPMNTSAGMGTRSLPSSIPKINTGEVDFNAGSEPSGGGFAKIAPYLSNIANQFSKPPMPVQRTRLRNVALNRVNFSNDRAEAGRMMRGANLAAERSLDGNTAAAVGAANMTQNMRSLSSINQAESNANSQISNQEVLMNSRIDSENAYGQDSFNNDVLERTMAIQGNRSANFANAADKFTAGQNEDANRDLDIQKMKINSRLYQDINPRFQEYLKGLGVDPVKKRFGGKLRRAF